MENQAFYDNLLKEVNDNLNYQEIQELKSLKKENVPLLEKKIQKLKKSIRFLHIATFTMLSLIILFAFLLQANISHKVNYYLSFILMFIPIALANALLGKNSMASLQKKIDTFELLLVLTKNEWAIAG